MLNREEIENIIKDTHPETYITTTKLFLDEILPEVLKEMIPDIEEDYFKEKAKEKYNITL